MNANSSLENSYQQPLTATVSTTPLTMVFYHHHILAPYFYIPVWMEEEINWWFPQPIIETTTANNCSICDSCINCNSCCEMCVRCNSAKKLNVNVQPFMPEDQMEMEFIRANPWIDE